MFHCTYVLHFSLVNVKSLFTKIKDRILFFITPFKRKGWESSGTLYGGVANFFDQLLCLSNLCCCRNSFDPRIRCGFCDSFCIGCDTNQVWWWCNDEMKIYLTFMLSQRTCPTYRHINLIPIRTENSFILDQSQCLQNVFQNI